LSHKSDFSLVRAYIAAVALSSALACAQAPSVLATASEPQLSPQSSASGASSTASASISGTVLDSNGDVIQDARVQLSRAETTGTLTEVKSGTTGQFGFSHLDPGTYVVTVYGNAMTTFVSAPITVHATESVTVPHVVLGVSATTTSITVVDKEQASIEQVRIAEQQRVFKVFPNFYSSFDPNAPPMLTRQKYRLGVRTLIDPVTFMSTAAIAGAEQYQNVFSSFGGGFEGYAKRYGAAYANHASSEMFTRAIFPSIFHTDPRYFIQGTGSTRDRALHAVSSTFVTRSDSGARRINFSQILGEFAASGLSNAYFPAKERGVSLVLVNGFAGLGGNMLDNLLREFVLNHLTSRAKP